MKDNDNTDISVLGEDSSEGQYTNVISFVEEKFGRARTARDYDETRWQQAYRNYRGIYGPDVQFTESEKSQVFIKVTKTKVLAAYGQINEVLLNQGSFPIGIEPTKLPEGVSESVHFDPKSPESMEAMQGGPGGIPEGFNVTESPYGYPGDERDTATKTNVVDTMGNTVDTAPVQEKTGPLREDLAEISTLKDGPGVTQSAITFHPAQVAAKSMEKKIKDQLDESAATRHLRHAIFDLVTFGTGIIKGPFAVDKEYPRWDEEGEYNPIIKTVPQVEHVSIWDFYPDPDAFTMEDASYVVQRHRMTRSQLRGLAKRPYFRKSSITEAISYGESYTQEDWETSLDDDGSTYGSVERFEVLEFWGTIDVSVARDNGMDVPKKYDDDEEIQINCWICNGELLRLVINPFTPKRIPYFACPYEVNPYSFFGVGLAENMDDTQTLMNGFMRMAVDNAALSGNLIFEIDEANLVPGQDLEIYPGKQFVRAQGAPGQGIFGTKFPNVAQENMMLFDKARVLADESTGLPSYSYGQTGVQSTGRTASGFSMMMGAASSSARTVIKNIDDFLLRPCGEAFFAFNMQFDYDPSIKGDLEVRARGTESFMQNEVRSQRLISFLQISSNPVLAPFAKFPYIIREIAETMGLDADKVANSPEEAFRQAQLLAQMQMQQQGPAEGPAAVGQDPMGTGGGNIGVGQAPGPGEQGFPTGGGANGGNPAPAQQPQGGTPPQGLGG